MASPRLGQGIQEEIKCPICWQHLTDPVTVECGHNFCQACVSDYCEKWEEHEPLKCPVCRAKIQKGNHVPNWQLANLVEGIKHLEFPGAEDVCERHKKELNLFCEEDGAVVCVACWKSPEHKSHSMLLMDEAAQKYKEQIQDELEILREERKRLEDLRVSESQKHQEYQAKTKAERQKVVSESQRLCQFIKEQERLLLAQLAELEREIEKSHEETVTKVSEEISHLDNLIREMERQCQKPPSNLLQGIRSTLSRCKKGKFQLPRGIFPELQTRLKSCSERNLRERVSLFQGNLQSYLEEGSYSKVKVTLDPDTANPQLLLSADRRRVRLGDVPQKLPDNPERFDSELCVLGHQGFISGRHCWEVEVQQGIFWAMGVAKESVRRKGKIHFRPEDGIWAVQRRFHQFQALTASTPIPLSEHQVPNRVWVCLDCAGENVSFFNGDTKALIFTFLLASFAGDRIRPWLWLKGTEAELRLCH